TEVRKIKVPLWSAKPKERFPYAKADKLMREYLPVKLANVSYDPASCSNITRDLSEEIKAMVKKVTPPRYKLICNVTIGKKDNEDLVVASRCLWDPYADNFVSQSYENHTLFCVVMVYAVYFE
uniref:Tctex1 domain containing 1 n=1 Tax=Latimeria chalumnae TaxID=7897 RepID=H3A9U4_LATCH